MTSSLNAGTFVHGAAPEERRIDAVEPATHTSLALEPQTALRVSLVPDGTDLHAAPSQCVMVPPEPTAQTSLALEPQTAVST